MGKKWQGEFRHQQHAKRELQGALYLKREEEIPRKQPNRSKANSTNKETTRKMTCNPMKLRQVKKIGLHIYLKRSEWGKIQR